MTVRVVARFFARPDTVVGLQGLLSGLLEPTRHEPGCLRYELLQNLTDPTDFTFVEEWRTQQDVAEHLQTAHVREAQQRVGAFVSQPPEIQSYRVIG